MKHKIIFITPEYIDWDCMEEILDFVDVVVYRSSTKEIEDKVKELKKIKLMCKKTFCLVEDDLELFSKVSTNGVLITKKGTNVMFARDAIGYKKMVGYKVSNLKDIEVASFADVDFFMAGNMFFDTDFISDKLLELEEVRLIKSVSSKPIVLMGGLTGLNITEQMIRVADGFAFSSYLFKDTSSKIERLKKLLNR